jgi:NTP pyrophosphatase (non-canonical NTP hydrolase)
LKKLLRSGTDGFTDQQKQAIQHQLETIVKTNAVQLEGEISDCVWYVAALVTDLNGTLSQVMKDNLAKLKARKSKGAIHNHKPDSQDHKEG